MEDKDLYGKDLPAPPKDRTAERGALSAKFRVGALDYALGGHPLWEIFSDRVSDVEKAVRHRWADAAGRYVTASIKHAQRPVSDELVAFRRREQMKRLKNSCWAASSHNPSSRPAHS